MPWAENWRTVFCTRDCSSLSTIGAGASMSVSPVSASVTFGTSCWRTRLSLPDLMRSAIDARHSAMVSNSPRFSATNSSVSSGTASSCTRCTVTAKSAGSSVPLGVAVNESSSPADAPMSSASNPSATQP